MAVTTAIAVYFIVWWLVLFAVLPFGIRSQQESGSFAQGTDPGAPTIAAIARKLVWTTVIAAIVFAIGATIYIYRLVSLNDLGTLWGLIG
jgi:predicted secreted protein